MEITVRCIRPLLMLLSALGQIADSVHLRLVPNKLQFFEYESLSFHCERLHGSAALKIVSVKELNLTTCKTTESAPELSFPITTAYPDDSGEYRCESGEKRSNSISITITPGPVILESPALPVTEGDAVTLRCRNRTTSPNLRADFYRDGRVVVNSSTETMTIHSVSKSDEGLYKCSIHGGGESAESWLAVNETHPSSDQLFLILRNVLPIVPVVLLLLLLGRLHRG